MTKIICGNASIGSNFGGNWQKRGSRLGNDDEVCKLDWKKRGAGNGPNTNEERENTRLVPEIGERQIQNSIFTKELHQIPSNYDCEGQERAMKERAPLLHTRLKIQKEEKEQRFVEMAKLSQQLSSQVGKTKGRKTRRFVKTSLAIQKGVKGRKRAWKG